MGQTTSFRKEKIKPSVLILGENKGMNEARYIHGEFGNGTWSFYGGHDSKEEAEQKVETACKKLLSNVVIESYEYEVKKA